MTGILSLSLASKALKDSEQRAALVSENVVNSEQKAWRAKHPECEEEKKDIQALVGKQVLLSTDVLELQEAKEAKGSVVVPQGVDTIDITIMSKNGASIKKITMAAQGLGVHEFSWDGVSDEGKAVLEGFYNFSAVGQSGKQSMPLYTAATYTVKRIALDKARGSIALSVKGLGAVSINDIIKVS